MEDRYLPGRKDRGEYAEACGKLRAMEKRLLGRDRLGELASAADAASVVRQLRRWGWAPRRGADGEGWEETIEAAQAAADRDLLSLDPRPVVTKLLVMKYELLNLSALLRAKAMKAEGPVRLHRRGLSTAAALETMVDRVDFSTYPASLARRLAALGDELLGEDPRGIAIAVARVHQRSLLEEAGREGSRLLADYLRHRADLENIKFRVRALRRPDLWGEEGILFHGGHLQDDLLFGPGWEEELLRRLARTVYGPVIEKSRDGQGRLSQFLLEKASDDFLSAVFEPAKFVSLGPEPIWAFFQARESESKSLRTIILGILAGEDRGRLRRNLRRPHV